MSIRLGRRNYNVDFVDDCSLEFTDPISGSDLAVDVFGLDILTRPYKCRIDEKGEVEKKLARLKNKADFEFPQMALVSWTEREDGPMVTFSCVFKGLFNGKMPEVRISGGMVKKTLTVGYQTVDGSTVTTSDTQQAQITYLAPTCTIRYVVRGIPKGPSYPGRMDNGTEIKIQRVEGSATGILQTAKRQVGGGAPLARRAIQSGFNTAEVVELESLNFEQVGLFSEVTETNAVELRPLDFHDRVKRIV